MKSSPPSSEFSKVEFDYSYIFLTSTATILHHCGRGSLDCQLLLAYIVMVMCDRANSFNQTWKPFGTARQRIKDDPD